MTDPAADPAPQPRIDLEQVAPLIGELIAELRAAREVIDSIYADTENEISMRTDIALDAYERATGTYEAAP